jgi:hypothetical protein
MCCLVLACLPLLFIRLLLSRAHDVLLVAVKVLTWAADRINQAVDTSSSRLLEGIRRGLRSDGHTAVIAQLRRSIQQWM